MKFFTRTWQSGHLTDEEWEAVQEAYQQHVQRLSPTLPPDLARLLDEISLHDALIRRIILKRTADAITLELRCGDQIKGYFNLDLLYEGVDWKYLELDVLANRARDRRTEVLYHELHRLEDGLYEHCFLFWPADETGIRFRDLRLTTTPCSDRRIDMGFDPFMTCEDLGDG